MFSQVKVTVLNRLPIKQFGWKSISLVIILLLFIAYRNFTPSRIHLLTFDSNLKSYNPFEPEVTVDFDTAEQKTFKIQRIIHQTWKNELVPPQFVEKIKSFVEHNPDWEYYLWTDASARKLVVDHYPQLLPLWDGVMYLTDKIRRADALRYIVLYHYGGVYADMDVIDFRPLDVAITKHPCIFIPEPYEQSVFRSFTPFLISNAIMMCAARHPFLKQLVENLVTVEHLQAVWDATGPGYVTTQYKLYNYLPREKEHFVQYKREHNADSENTSPYFYQGEMAINDQRSVYIANSQYFIFSLDEDGFRTFYWKCLWFNFLTHLQKRACVNMVRKGLSRDPNKYAITDHKWYRTYGWKNFYNYLSAYNAMVSTHIKDIVPRYKIYTDSRSTHSNESKKVSRNGGPR